MMNEAQAHNKSIGKSWADGRSIIGFFPCSASVRAGQAALILSS